MFGWMKRLTQKPVLKDDGIEWITSKCSEDGCNEVGMFPTSKPFDALDRKHFCIKHNKRLCTGIGQ